MEAKLTQSDYGGRSFTLLELHKSRSSSQVMSVTQRVLEYDNTYIAAGKDLIMKSGQNIRYLSLEDDRISMENGNPEQSAYLLKLAFEYCPNLESLCLKSFDIQRMQYDLFFEPGISLRHLELYNCCFYSEYLTSILQGIPYLKTLKLSYCKQLDMITEEIQTNSSISMYMPNTSFNSIYFYDSFRSVDAVIFKIITYGKNQTRYFSYYDLKAGVLNAKFEEETQEMYIEKYKSRENHSYKFYSIICKSVEKIDMTDDRYDDVIRSYTV